MYIFSDISEELTSGGFLKKKFSSIILAVYICTCLFFSYNISEYLQAGEFLIKEVFLRLAV